MMSYTYPQIHDPYHVTKAVPEQLSVSCAFFEFLYQGPLYSYLYMYIDTSLDVPVKIETLHSSFYK